MPPIQTSAVTPNSNFRSFGRPFESLRMKRPKKRDVEIQTKRIPSRELTIISHLGKKEDHHLQTHLRWWYISSQEGIKSSNTPWGPGICSLPTEGIMPKITVPSCSTSSSCSCSCSWTCSLLTNASTYSKSTDLSKGKKTPAVMVYRCFQK